MCVLAVLLIVLLYVAFVDFRKAFESVRHCKLLETLRKECVFGKFEGAIKAMYNSLLSCVRVKNEYTDFFECPNGVRQACVLSPTLFCLFINQLAEHIQSTGKHGVQMLSGLIELFILLFELHQVDCKLHQVDCKIS